MKKKRRCEICGKPLSMYNRGTTCWCHVDGKSKPFKLSQMRNARERNEARRVGRPTEYEVLPWPSLADEYPCHAYGYNRA